MAAVRRGTCGATRAGAAHTGAEALAAGCSEVLRPREQRIGAAHELGVGHHAGRRPCRTGDAAFMAVSLRAHPEAGAMVVGAAGSTPWRPKPSDDASASLSGRCAPPWTN
jgi:hypothetical protein